MCSLYSINNNSKFAGQSTFQVVLCAKGSDGNNGSKGYYSAHSSSCSSASWSTSPCSYSRRKKMKGVAGADANIKAPVVVLSSSTTQHQSKDVIQNCNLFNPPSFQSHQNHHQRISFNASHYPPLGRTSPSAQPYQQHQHRRRQGSNSYGNTHWHQFHQHNQLHSFDTAVEYEQHDNHRHQSHVYPQKRASWSSDWQQHNSNSNSLKDSGNRRSFPILNSASNTQFHSKSHTLASTQPSATPFPQASSCPSPALSPTPAPAPAPASNLSRTAEPAIISFAAAVTAAAVSTSSVASDKYASASSIAPAEMSPSRSTLSSYFETNGNCGSVPAPLSTIETVDPLSSSTAGQCIDGIDVTLTDPKMPQHSRLVLNRSIEDNDGLSPLGSSVESNSNETFDGDVMDSHQSSVTDAIDSDDASSDSHSPHGSEMTTAEAARVSPLLSNHSLPLQRKSRLRQKVDRLKSKNSALQSTVNQMRSDLARERQMRSAIDEIYLKIKSDLNQRLENEELKNLNLTMEMEQMATEMKDLKDQLATHKASTSASSTATRSSPVTGYRIGYDNSSFSLSNGISNIEGLMLHSQSLSQSTLMDGQDDSEEFLLSHSYSPSVVQSTQSASAVSAPTRTATSTFMSCSEDEDEDENMATDHSDDEPDRDIKSLTFKLTQPSRSDSRGASVSPAMTLPALIEEEDAEEMEESDGEGEPCEEHDDAPRTVMEMIIQRQMAYTPEDDMENPPADADETFETMAQSILYQAIPSRFTVAQMHMQLEDLMSKYGARLDQAVDVLAKELSRWWEIERLAVGGPAAGGWGSDTVINKQTGERVNPKAAVEKRVETFFGPLFLQFVATSSEQKLLLEKLELYAQKDASWLRNHNAVLVALYKYDVVETEAILEWWRGLEAPRGIFGHGGNNLRSLNSKFVAWLEDEEDDSDSEEEDGDEDEDYESDSESDEEDDSSDDDDDDDDDEEEEEDRDYSNDDATKREQVADRGEDSASSDSNSRSASTASSLSTSPTSPTLLSKQTAQGEGSNNTKEDIDGVVEPKRRISFCTNNNMYYSQDGTVCSEKNLSSGGTETSNGKNETEDKMSSKKYAQCPPFVALNEADNSGDNDENASASMDEGDEEGAKDTTADIGEE